MGNIASLRKMNIAHPYGSGESPAGDFERAPDVSYVGVRRVGWQLLGQNWAEKSLSPKTKCRLLARLGAYLHYPSYDLLILLLLLLQQYSLFHLWATSSNFPHFSDLPHFKLECGFRIANFGLKLATAVFLWTVSKRQVFEDLFDLPSKFPSLEVNWKTRKVSIGPLLGFKYRIQYLTL